MSTVILAEKPDQARAYMKALDIPFTGKATIGSGPTFLDDKTVVVSAAGHLIELVEPEVYDNAYKDRHNLAILPLIPAKFQYAIMKDKQWLFSQIKRKLMRLHELLWPRIRTTKAGPLPLIFYA